MSRMHETRSEDPQADQLRTGTLPVAIPEDECEVSFSRSGGPGGQNVNKVNTHVHLKWRFDQSERLDESQVETIRAKLHNRINNDGYLVVDCQKTRSQNENRAIALERLNELVNDALTPEKERRATKPTKASKVRRKEDKQRNKRKKELRRDVGHDD